MSNSHWRLAIVAAATVHLSCYHSMEILNLNDYTHEAAAPHKLALIADKEPDTADGRNLAIAVFDSLSTHASVERMAVVDKDKDFTPDAYITVVPTTAYEGSGWNFLITFPGFILFTHAWNGFVYEAAVRTDVTVRLADSEKVVTKTIETRYDLRHCDFERGAVTSSGWYTPGWGGLNILFGLYMINYDVDATPDFLQEVRVAYGKFIANSIVEIATNELSAGKSAPDSAAEPSCAVYNRATHRFEDGCDSRSSDSAVDA